MVSIIVPIYKVEKYIEKSLYSVINQSYKDIELILVNDCTPDASMEIVMRVLSESNYPSKYIKILNLPKNKGLSNARNQGLAVAEGEFVFFMDSDDIITEDCIESHVKAIKKTGAEFTDANIKIIGAKNIFSCYTHENYIEGKDEVIKSFFVDFHVSAWNKLIRKNILTSNGILFKPGILYEDAIWLFSLCLAANSCVQIEKYTYNYVIRESSITTSITSQNIIRQFDSFRVLIDFFINQFEMLGLFKYSVEREKWFGKLCFKVKARFLNHPTSREYRDEYLNFLSSKRVTKFVSPIYKFLLMCPFPLFILLFKLPDKIYRKYK